MKRLDTLRSKVDTRTITTSKFVLAAAVVLVLVFVPNILPSYWVGVLTRALIFALFATAFNIVFGMGGMPALGHAAFFGASGYVVALGTVRWNWSFLLIVTMVLMLGLIMGLLFGLLSARSDGVYLLLLTLALAEAIHALVYVFPALTRGDSGIPGVARATIPFEVTSAGNFYLFVLGVVVVCMALMRWFTDTPVGRVIVAHRESPSRMASVGYHVAAYKVVAFVMSGVFSCVAGFLSAYHHQIIAPTSMAILVSATIMLMAILGGALTFFGPAIGAAIIVLLEFYLNIHTARWMSILGLLFVLVMLLLPSGVIGFLDERLRVGRMARLGWEGGVGSGEAASDDTTPDPAQLTEVAAGEAVDRRHADDG